MVAVCPPPPKLGHFYLPRTVPLYLTPSLLSHLLNQISLWIPRWHWRVAFRRPLTLACSVCVPRSSLASWTTSPAAVAAAAVAAMTAGTTRGRTHNLKRPTAALPSISRVRVCDAVCFDAEFCVSSFFSAAVGEHPMTHINRPGALLAAFRCALPFHPGLGSDEYINLLRYIYTGSLDGDAMSPSGLVALQTTAVRLDLPILARLTAALQPDSGEPLFVVLNWRFSALRVVMCHFDPLPVSTHPHLLVFVSSGFLPGEILELIRGAKAAHAAAFAARFAALRRASNGGRGGLGVDWETSRRHNRGGRSSGSGDISGDSSDSGDDGGASSEDASVPSSIGCDLSIHFGSVESDAAVLVDRSILAARSPLYAAMFTSPMQEGSADRIAVDHVGATAFLVFLRWIYTNRSVKRSGRGFVVGMKAEGLEILRGFGVLAACECVCGHPFVPSSRALPLS